MYAELCFGSENYVVLHSLWSFVRASPNFDTESQLAVVKSSLLLHFRARGKLAMRDCMTKVLKDSTRLSPFHLPVQLHEQLQYSVNKNSVVPTLFSMVLTILQGKLSSCTADLPRNQFPSAILKKTEQHQAFKKN